MRPAWGRSAGMQHDKHRGQGSEELGWVLAQSSSWTFFHDEKAWRRNIGSGEEGVRFSLRLAHVRVRAALVCPVPHRVSVGSLEEGERAAQEESYLKQRLWSEASQRVYQASSIPDTLAPSLTPAFVSTVGTAAVDCCKGPCLLLCVFVLQRTNARQRYRQTRNPRSSR